MSIIWKEISNIEQEELQQALQLYDASFPPEVRESHEVFYTGIRRGQHASSPFHFLVGLLDERVIAFVAGHYLREVNTGFVVYIAVDPSSHRGGAGTEALRQLEYVLQQDAKQAGYSKLSCMVLETEKSELAHTEEERLACERRYRFFEKNGYRASEAVPYMQPPLDGEQELVPLRLFLKAEPTTSIDVTQLVPVMYQEKYGAVNGISAETLQFCLRKMRLVL